MYIYINLLTYYFLQNSDVHPDMVPTWKYGRPPLMGGWSAAPKSTTRQRWQNLQPTSGWEWSVFDDLRLKIHKEHCKPFPNSCVSSCPTWNHYHWHGPTLELSRRVFQLPLTTLYLQRNQIRSLDGLEQVTRLTVLDVSHNKLETLPDIFVHLTSLEVLNIAGNSIAELPDSIGSARRLTEFNCSHNRLCLLPNSIGNAVQLTILDVSNNRLASLPFSVGNLNNLRDFRARNNSLRSLPKTFSQLRRLTSLILRSNKFDHIPSQLSSLASLENLNMADNQIAHMDKYISPLKFLVLDQNDFTQIDAGIVQCTNLQFLSMKRNRLGHITENIGQLTNLRSLFLSHNPISCIPVELVRLTHLLHLTLSSTNIQTIPHAVASLSSLQTLELQDCTELDRQLQHAYNTTGPTGVMDYFKQQPKTETQSGLNTKTSNDVTFRPNSKARVRMAATESLLPADTQTVASPQNSEHVVHASLENYCTADSRDIADVSATVCSAQAQRATTKTNARPVIPKKPVL